MVTETSRTGFTHQSGDQRPPIRAFAVLHVGASLRCGCAFATDHRARSRAGASKWAVAPKGAYENVLVRDPQAIGATDVYLGWAVRSWRCSLASV
jgi:hypothetical protein